MENIDKNTHKIHHFALETQPTAVTIGGDRDKKKQKKTTHFNVMECYCVTRCKK